MSGPIKPMPPPNLHGHTCRGVSGELYAALLEELGPEVSSAGGRYLTIGPNVIIWPRFDPPGRVNVAELFAADRRRAEDLERRHKAIWRWGRWLLAVAALPFLLVFVDWLAGRYGAYFAGVLSIFR